MHRSGSMSAIGELMPVTQNADVLMEESFGKIRPFIIDSWHSLAGDVPADGFKEHGPPDQLK